ncbi:MAG: transposase [Aureispira sp.]|nr:transposase [Aureispira sp.]
MKKRKFTPKFKTKVVLEALKELSSLSELAKKYNLAPTQVSTWKRQFLEGAEGIFNTTKGGKPEEEREKDKLLQTIGALKVENDFLKKVLK